MGHLRSACTEKSKYIFCSRCSSKSHTEETCPSIWRSYKVIRSGDSQYPASISCYNCAGAGHYGDDCPLPRPVLLRYREATAFCVESLAPKFQKKYHEELRNFKPDFKQAESYRPPSMTTSGSQNLNRKASSRSIRSNASSRNDHYSRDYRSTISSGRGSRDYDRDYNGDRGYGNNGSYGSSYSRGHEYSQSHNHFGNSSRSQRSFSPPRSSQRSFGSRIQKAASSARNAFKRNR
ncbi:Air1p [Sugiyamaella lignohabitans]|uniref:Air1p n=1 Tax=Sugiyamaella lignohabitans TaxID=796027 RepID=A0A167EHL1_9ASCO|nr:Air1p [Sugiyamaella lignohabitans]ANB14092.1 Air1p [Sugiyamaella lignohabitans]